MLPFPYTLSFPILLILGELSPQEIAANFGMQAVWVVLSYLIFRLIWRAGLKQFSAVGA